MDQTVDVVDGKDDHGEAAELASLRDELGKAVELLRHTVEQQASQAATAVAGAAEDGVEGARNLVRSYPLEAMAVASLMGVAVAMLITRPAAPRHAGLVDGAHRSLQAMQPDWHGIADRMARSARETTAPILPTVERVVDSISKFDASSGPWQRLSSLWREVQGTFENK